MNIRFFDSFNSQASSRFSAEQIMHHALNDTPSDDFVLCRDAAGNPTAVYGEDVWDLNPLRLSAKKINTLRFDVFNDKADIDAQCNLIRQSKYVVFCLMYYVDTGRLGRLSVSTVYNLFSIVRLMSLYCYDQRARKLVGILTLKQLLSTPVYLADFLSVSRLSGARVKFFRQLIVNLQALGESFLGFRVASADGLEFDIAENSQHPVIPTRIYLEVINRLSDSLERIYPLAGRLEKFLTEFSDRNYGLTHYVQKTYGIRKHDRRLTMSEAIAAHDLEGLFEGEFTCSHRRALMSAICKIQYIIKCVIHVYTGMRDQEVMRLPYDCIGQAEVSPALMDEQGKVRDPARMIDLISTTTKFTGYRSEASWLATPEVVKAVEVARHICNGLAEAIGVNAESLPLFINPSIINYERADIGVSALGNKHKPIFLANILIESGDLAELVESAQGQVNVESFSVGQVWKLTGHQFRRSLAFYGSSSGFISIPSLKRQFKHLTLAMARYYSNNFEKIKTIFGCYDPELDDFVLPSNHIAFEFQMAMPIGVAYDLLSQVFEDSSVLIGGAGSYIHKQRERLGVDGALIAEVRADTERRVRDGQISYRRTLLGGCTKVGECDSYMLGEFVSCLSCEGAIIRPACVAKAIEITTAELEQYEVGSGEYQVTKGDLERLLGFAGRRISAVEVM